MVTKPLIQPVGRKKLMPGGVFQSPGKIRQIITQQNRGKTITGAPQFPGTAGGMSMDQVREFIMNQKRAKGFSFTTSIGNNDVKIDLPGDARLMLGFAFEIPNNGDTFDMEVNNDKVIDNASELMHSSQVLFASGGLRNFIEYLYPLDSKQTINFNYRAGASFDQNLTIYFI